MENKINVSELLSNCPSGMELDCTIWDNVTFECVDNREEFSIIIRLSDGCREAVTDYGCYSENEGAKCVIFPKGKTTWEGFVPPCHFKDGDILFVDCSDGEDKGYQYIFILNKPEFYGKWHSYCHLDGVGDFHSIATYLAYDEDHPRFATEEEKELLFRAIKKNGYKWNPENKTLEKLTPNPDKFDITSLKTFDQVLVRDFDNTPWEIEFFSRLLDGKHFKCSGLSYMQCIPYKGNEHLNGKKDDCDKYFKTWE